MKNDTYYTKRLFQKAKDARQKHEEEISEAYGFTYPHRDIWRSIESNTDRSQNLVVSYFHGCDPSATHHLYPRSYWNWSSMDLFIQLHTPRRNDFSSHLRKNQRRRKQSIFPDHSEWNADVLVGTYLNFDMAPNRIRK